MFPYQCYFLALKPALQVPGKSVLKLECKEGTATAAIKIEGREEEIIESHGYSGSSNGDEGLTTELNCTFSAGELAWARVGTAPFWPCTFTYDPDLKIHSYDPKLQANGLGRSHREV